METFYHTTLKTSTPLGTLQLAATDRGLAQLGFIKANGDTSDMPSALNASQEKNQIGSKSPSHMKPYVSQLKAYLAGELNSSTSRSTCVEPTSRKNVGAPCLRSLMARRAVTPTSPMPLAVRTPSAPWGKPTTQSCGGRGAVPSRDHHCRHARRIWWRLDVKRWLLKLEGHSMPASK